MKTLSLFLLRIVTPSHLVQLAFKNRETATRFLILFILFFYTGGTLLAQTTWTGRENSVWTNASNWSDGVPDASDAVIIPDVANNPVIRVAGALANSISVQSGGVLTITTAGTLTVNGGVDWGIENLGAINCSGAITIGAAVTHGIRNHAIFSNTGGQITINNSTTNGIFNDAGTFTSTGTILIGNLADSGITGILNRATFKNNTGGEIKIDRTTREAIRNNTGGTFTNRAAIVLGAEVSPGSTAISNYGSFDNSTNGQIDIDRSTDFGIHNANNSTFTNQAALNIGLNTSAGNEAIQNNAIFNNSAGQINIGNLTSFGITNMLGATFNNLAGILMASTGSRSSFISNNSTFNHNGGQIIMNGSAGYGIENGLAGTFTNHAVISICGISGSTFSGIHNTGTFDSNAGSSIQVDRFTEFGIYNSSKFTNAASITIGGIAGTGKNGISNISVFNNNIGGLIKVDRCSTLGITSNGTFTNNATITIGSISSVGNHGIRAFGWFKNGGQINVDRTSVVGIYVSGVSTQFFNEGTIRVGSIERVGASGISLYNSSDFFNERNSQLHIDRASIGVYADNYSYFANTGDITIGALAPIATLVKMQADMTASALFAHSIGTLKGSGTLSAGFLGQGGTLAPGNSPGIMTIESPGNGLYNGTLAIEVDGTGVAGVDFDQIVAIGAANIANIELALSINYTPAIGDRVTILSATAVTGTFEAVTGLPENWFVHYTPTSVILVFGEGSPLPVTLVSFSGKRTTENQNVLTWSTADEKDFDRFEIERSDDAKSFEKIGTIRGGKDMGAAVRTYSFTDLFLGISNYYRLKMIDGAAGGAPPGTPERGHPDGSYEYSRIIFIENPSEQAVVGSFYPNPSSGNVRVDVNAPESGRWNLTVFDISGKSMATSAYDLRKGKNTITLEHLAEGIHLVRFEYGRFSEMRRLIRD